MVNLITIIIIIIINNNDDDKEYNLKKERGLKSKVN